MTNKISNEKRYICRRVCPKVEEKLDGQLVISQFRITIGDYAYLKQREVDDERNRAQRVEFPGKDTNYGIISAQGAKLRTNYTYGIRQLLGILGSGSTSVPVFQRSRPSHSILTQYEHSFTSSSQ
jgi:hypothetical protein